MFRMLPDSHIVVPAPFAFLALRSGNLNLHPFFFRRPFPAAWRLTEETMKRIEAPPRKERENDRVSPEG